MELVTQFHNEDGFGAKGQRGKEVQNMFVNLALQSTVCFVVSFKGANAVKS